MLLLLFFLAACALLWFGYQNLKHPADRYASRIYRTASLTTAPAYLKLQNHSRSLLAHSVVERHVDQHAPIQ